MKKNLPQIPREKYHELKAATIPLTEKRRSWRYILGLIAGIDATAAQKYFLHLILNHGYRHKGFAWASKETLAREMSVGVPVVERTFRWAMNIGVVGAGNHAYWLNVERLKELQRGQP